MPDDPITQADEPTEDARLDKLEATQEQQGATLERIEAMLSKVIPGSHAEAEQRTEERLDRPNNLSEQVRAELAKAKADEAAEREKEDERSERQQIKDTLAAMREKPPAPPPNPLKKFATLGWGDG